ncbi:MAG: MATE family efflux transporter, partial [Candidatus Omnitrophota bacterium]|nr:MATE family efflux transporter [Candidatus Omnitrophota bacterium]
MAAKIEQSLSQKIVRNTIFNAVGRFWGILVALFLTPYIIHHIGIERFGILAIVGAITGYFGLFDFGIGTSFVKYIAEFYAKKEYKKINQVVNTGFIFYSVFAILIIILAFFIINPILTLFKIPAHLYDE